MTSGKVWMALVSALLCMAFVHAQAPRSDTAAALAKINEGNVFEGIRMLKEIARAEPSSASAHFYLSSLYTRMGRYDRAFGYLQVAMKANPGQGPYHNQLGIIRRYEGCQPEALTAFQQALRAGMGKEEVSVWRQIGEVHVDLLAWDRAQEAYGNALRIDPKNAGIRLALGRLYLERNDPARAIEEIQSALKGQPGLAGAHASLGRAYRASGDLTSAVNVLKQGIESNPTDQEARYVLGQVLLALGRTDEGRHEMETYRRVDEQMTQTDKLVESAVQRAQAGDLERAEELLKDTLRLAPRYAPALHLLGVVLLNRGNSQRALEMLRQASIANPLNAESYFQMGSAYLNTGQLSQALDMNERALVLEDEDPRYYALLATIQSRMNRPAAPDAARDTARATARAEELKSRPGYRPADPYTTEMRRRDDAATVKEICGQHADQ